MKWLWVLRSLTITITGLAFLEPLLKLLGSTSEIYPYAVEYGRIMLIGTIISTGVSGIMQRIQPMLGFDWGRILWSGRNCKIIFCRFWNYQYRGNGITDHMILFGNWMHNACSSSLFSSIGIRKKGLIFAIRLPLLLIAWRLDNLDIIWWILVLTEWLIAELTVNNYKLHAAFPNQKAHCVKSSAKNKMI